jgi:uncharacterized protein (TIGR00369 family)
MSDNLTQWMDQNPYIRDLGVKIQAADDTVVRLFLPYQERNTMAGTLHGGAIASLISISGRALVRASAPEPAGALCTVSMHVGYVRAARKSVKIETRLVRRASDLVFFETWIKDEDDHEVAHASAMVSDSRPGMLGSSPPLLSDVLPSHDGASPSVEPGRLAELRAAMAGIAFVSRRELHIQEIARGTIGIKVGTAAVNLDGHGFMDEGVVLTLIDAAGATCPWTTVSPSSGASGSTVALTAQVLGPLPKRGLVARAAIRAWDARFFWTDVTVSDELSGRLHALGMVLYRFKQESHP